MAATCSDAVAATKFALSKDFVAEYAARPVPFGYGGLGEFVFYRTYSRQRHDVEGAPLEKWHETIERVVNGAMNMLRRHLKDQWREDDHVLLAKDMYDRMFTMKFLPSGRGLWAMGSPLTEERQLYAALSNCGFVSTLYIGNTDREKALDPFLFLMDACMCGIGIGFDTLGAGHRRIISEPQVKEAVLYIIDDSREGWVDSLRLLLSHYFFDDPLPVFEYGLLRLAGTPIRTFGGVSGGPEPLKKMHTTLSTLFRRRRGEFLSVTDIVDIMNIIGACVVSGNVRRSAEIALGPNTQEFIDLKNYKVNAHRKGHMWISNNSVKATIDTDYTAIAESIMENGEPGIFWTENVQAYSRMRPEEKDHKDQRAIGTNPCAEQPLEHHELCCLVETFPAKHDSLHDFVDTLSLAMFYAKIVSLGETQWPETNKVLRRNRRVGVSMSGIVQFIYRYGREELARWCEEGYTFLKDYDVRLSQTWGVSPSIKITTVKPSGTVSLLAGATPGVHYPISPYYIRRVRISKTSTLLQHLKDANYSIVEANASENALVVEFPVFAGFDEIRSESSVSMVEQLELVAFMQRHWSDNGVSATIKFDKESEGEHIAKALDTFQHHLKAISFLPNEPGVYHLAPYEAITERQYYDMTAGLKHIVWHDATNNEPKMHEYCGTDGCTPIRRKKSPKADV